MIHYGTSSRNYIESVDIGSPVPLNGRVNGSVINLAPEQTYYFTVTAYNSAGQESAYANEIASTIPADAINTTPADSIDTTQFDIYMSRSSNLSGAVTLNGALVEGGIYVFTGPDAGVSLVTFSVDGTIAKTESQAPFELVGGAAFDTSQLSPGKHEIAANIKLTDGSTRQVCGVFSTPSTDGSTVDTSAYDVLVTTSPNLSGPVPLDGAIVDGDIYVFTGPDTGVSNVIFSVDGVVAKTEVQAPFELVGGAAFDASKLSPGKHEITAKLKLTDGSTELISAIFSIPSVVVDTANDSLHDVLVSKASNRSGAIALDGATVNGDIYVFTGPDTGVSNVIFSVDGVVAKTESLAPFELVGGAAFDASKLSPGQHEITAKLKLTDSSTEVISAIFTVPSAQATPVSNSRCNLLYSNSSYLSSAMALEGATVKGDIYVFTGPDTGVSRVIFSVDGVITQTESLAPFELVGGAAFNTSQLSAGKHKVSASISFSDRSSELISASFTVK